MTDISNPNRPDTVKRRRRTRAGRGALFVIATLLFGSGMIRVGLEASHALATTSEEPVQGPADGICEVNPDVATMLDDLQGRAERLEKREAQVEDRARAVEIAKTEIDKRLEALAKAEETLAATIAQADNAAEKDVSKLVAVYEQMKPKDAAALFGEMDPDFAAGFLARMRPDAAAALMAGLEPKTAYTISVLLAGRNANAPKN
ncbi:MAG: hypothetical protein KDE03_07335 [Rhodobacteraceae bacterium]|nr:hypothetical protein [Paracoccaceae bacterium]